MSLLKIKTGDENWEQLLTEDSIATTIGASSTDDEVASAKAVNTAVSGKEDSSNKVTTMSAASTDTQYPSAKAVYEGLTAIEEDLDDKEDVANKVTSMTAESTDTQYPSAKAVYTEIAALEEDLDDKEDVANKVTSMTAESTDTQYPSAKAVYDGLAAKEAVANKVTSMTAESTDTQYPSAKAVYDGLATKEAVANKVTSITAEATDTQYPSAKAVYTEIAALEEDLDDKEDLANKVTQISAASTDTEYPTAKAVYDALGGAIGVKFYESATEPENAHLGDIWKVTTPTPTDKDYFYALSVPNDGTVTLAKAGSPTFTPSLQYSTDKSSWTNVTVDTPIRLPANTPVYFKGENYRFGMSPTYPPNDYYHFVFDSSAFASYMIGGNIMSLLDPTVQKTTLTADNDCAFYKLFENNTGLLSINMHSVYPNFEHSDLSLPATALSPYCYFGMFCGCTGLAIDLNEAGVTFMEGLLPATTVAQECYDRMFSGCSNVHVSAKLPATNLSGCALCYNEMFKDSGVIYAMPILATTVAKTDFSDLGGQMTCMFENCTGLKYVPKLYSTDLFAAFMMPELNTYTSMFNGCSSLEVNSMSTASTTYEWKIPNSGAIDGTATFDIIDFLTGTTGDYSTSGTQYVTGDVRSFTFYVKNEPV